MDCVDSTQTIAESKIEALEPNAWYLWTAEEQRAGRGHCGRIWHSPRGKNIYATYAFVTEAVEQMQSLAQVSAYSVMEALSACGFDKAKIGWINDILVNKKKLGGVLASVHLIGSKKAALLIGAGINVNCTEGDLEAIGRQATSLLVETGKKWNREKILEELSRRLTINVEILLKFGFTQFQNKISALLELFDGAEIALIDNNITYRGKIVGLDAIGGLILSTRQKSFTSGRIVDKY